MSGLGSRVSGLESRVLGIGFLVLGFGFLVLGLGFQEEDRRVGVRVTREARGVARPLSVAL